MMAMVTAVVSHKDTQTHTPSSLMQLHLRHPAHDKAAQLHIESLLVSTTSNRACSGTASR